jgi:dipeptidase E
MFLHTPAEAVEGPCDWLSEERHSLVVAGYEVTDFSITNKSLAELDRALEDTDIIFVTGGNDFYFIHQVELTGCRELFRKHVAAGKIYIGSSTGTAAGGKHLIAGVRETMEQRLGRSDIEGLGLTDLVVIGHFGDPAHKQGCLKDVEDEFARGNKVVLLTNYQYLRIDGDCYRIESCDPTRTRRTDRIFWAGFELRARDHGAPGVVVGAVEPHMPAAIAGVAVGDVIRRLGMPAALVGVAVGGAVTRDGDVDVESPYQVGELLRLLRYHHEAVLTIERGGEVLKLGVTRPLPGYCGINPSPVTAAQCANLGVTEANAVRVRSISPDSPAERVGILAGDILVQFASAPIDAPRVRRQLARVGAGETIDIVVIRGTERLAFEVPLAIRPEGVMPEVVRKSR